MLFAATSKAGIQREPDRHLRKDDGQRVIRPVLTVHHALYPACIKIDLGTILLLWLPSLRSIDKILNASTACN